MRSQIDSYSMLISSKYLRNIKDMINVTFVNSKFKDNFDKFHFNPFQINHKTRHYFINLQTQWLFSFQDRVFKDDDISAYYVHHEVCYDKYLEMKKKYRNIKFRRIIYTKNDKRKYGNQIPNVIHKLSGYLFSRSGINGIREIVIPDSIVEIGKHCFERCYPLTSITISSRLTNIGDSAFYYCNHLLSITLPSVLTSFNKRLFSFCDRLHGNDENSDNDGGIRLTKIDTPPHLYKIGDQCFYGCYDTPIPTKLIPQLQHIGSGCYYGKGITELTLNNQMTYIGGGAFSDNPIKSVIIPSSLSCLNSSFFSCSELTHIELPDSITCFGDYTFSECINLRTLILPNSITKLGRYSFHKCSSLEYIVTPHLIKELPDNSFEECKSLTRIELFSSLTKIGKYCFCGCIKLEEINIPMSVIEIGNAAFKDCSELQSITGNIDLWIKSKESFENTPFFKQHERNEN